MVLEDRIPYAQNHWISQICWELVCSSALTFHAMKAAGANRLSWLRWSPIEWVLVIVFISRKVASQAIRIYEYRSLDLQSLVTSTRAYLLFLWITFIESYLPLKYLGRYLELSVDSREQSGHHASGLINFWRILQKTSLLKKLKSTLKELALDEFVSMMLDLGSWIHVNSAPISLHPLTLSWNFV